MEQVLISGYYNLTHDTDTEYTGIWGGGYWTTAATVTVLASPPGKIKELRVELSDSPGGAASYTISLYHEGAPATLTTTITGAETSGSDLVHEVTVAGGETVCVQIVPSGTPTARYVRFTMIFEGTNAKESWLPAVTYLDAATKKNTALMSSYRSSVIESVAHIPFPTGGKIKNLYVKMINDPGDIGVDAYTYGLRQDVNDTALTVTITADDKTGNDTTHEVTVAAGEMLCWSVDPIDSPSNDDEAVYMGATFVADTDGESIISGPGYNTLHNTDTEYNYLAAMYGTSIWGATEAERYQLISACVLKKLYMWLSAAPGAGNKYTFTMQDTGNPTSLVVEIADAATTGNSAALTATLGDGDEVDLMCVPTSTPDAAWAKCGLVCYIAPVAGLSIPVAMHHYKMMRN